MDGACWSSGLNMEHGVPGLHFCVDFWSCFGLEEIGDRGGAPRYEGTDVLTICLNRGITGGKSPDISYLAPKGPKKSQRSKIPPTKFRRNPYLSQKTVDS